MDQLSNSPAQSHLIMSATRRDLLRRKRPVPPSRDHQTSAASTSMHSEHEPLFLPEPDEEQGPSTSAENPLFLPEEREERPKKKKRRISSKAPQLRTLNDLWRPRQVSNLSPDLIAICSSPWKIHQQNSSPSPTSSSNPHQVPTPVQHRKKRNLQSKLGRKSGVFYLYYYDSAHLLTILNCSVINPNLLGNVLKVHHSTQFPPPQPPPRDC